MILAWLKSGLCRAGKRDPDEETSNSWFVIGRGVCLPGATECADCGAGWRPIAEWIWNSPSDRGGLSAGGTLAAARWFRSAIAKRAGGAVSGAHFDSDYSGRVRRAWEFGNTRNGAGEVASIDAGGIELSNRRDSMGEGEIDGQLRRSWSLRVGRMRCCLRRESIAA